MISRSIDDRGPGTDGGGTTERTSAKAPRRYLVVANLTICGEQLAMKVRRCLQEGPCSFHVVVPASPERSAATWTEEGVLLAAGRRLDQALAMFQMLGADVTGQVGDWAPVLAIEDALRGRAFDEIIVSTLRPGPSHWIRLDLPNRVARRFGLPVSHVVSPMDVPSDGGVAATPQHAAHSMPSARAAAVGSGGIDATSRRSTSTTPLRAH